MKRREGGQPRTGRPRYAILVYCGGLRTEPDYLDGLKKALRGEAVTIKVRYEGIAPASLVRRAAAYRDRQVGAYDEVWCVFDVDEFDIGTAVAEAGRQKVNLAVSNSCFELWLLLHHADCRSHCNGYDDVVRRLKKHVPAYDKTRLRFADYADGVGDATKRAKDLDPTGTQHRRNPSTNMWRLVERIVERRS